MFFRSFSKHLLSLSLCARHWDTALNKENPHGIDVLVGEINSKQTLPGVCRVLQSALRQSGSGDGDSAVSGLEEQAVRDLGDEHHRQSTKALQEPQGVHCGWSRVRAGRKRPAEGGDKAQRCFVAVSLFSVQLPNHPTYQQDPIPVLPRQLAERFLC